MKCNSVFRGNIKICTNINNIKKGHIFKSQLYKENATIIHKTYPLTIYFPNKRKISLTGFVDTGNKLKDSLIILKSLLCSSKNNIFINQNPTEENSLWLDVASLSQYYHPHYNNATTKIKQLKLNETNKDIIH